MNMFTIDLFVSVEFSKLYFTEDWPTVKLTFLKKYSTSFLENMKKHLNVNFYEEDTLRSFVELKLLSLSTYTKLPFVNRMEMVLNDLPVEISSLFLLNEKLTCDKEEILDFCDSIQDIVETKHGPVDQESEITENNQEQALNRWSWTIHRIKVVAQELLEAEEEAVVETKLEEK